MREILSLKNFTQAELATILNVDTSRVKSLANGRVNKFTQAEQAALVERLHVRPEWLVSGEGSPFGDTSPVCQLPDMVFVNKVRARASAGNGSLEVDADPVGRYAFRREWAAAKGQPTKMVLMDVVGDSMAPDICHGDMVLIDESQTEVIGGAIYAVSVEGAVYIKRVDMLPGKLSLGSNNPAYPPIIVDMRGDLADTVRIVGRVIWWCREAR